MEKMKWRDTAKKTAREDVPAIIDDIGQACAHVSGTYHRRSKEEKEALNHDCTHTDMIYLDDEEKKRVEPDDGYTYGYTKEEGPIYQPESPSRPRGDIENWNLLAQGVVCLLLVLFLSGISKIPRVGPFFVERYRNVLVYDVKDKLEPLYSRGWIHVKNLAAGSWNVVSSWFATEINEALAPPNRSFIMTLPVKGKPEMQINRDESGDERLGMVIPKGTDIFSSSAGVVREVETYKDGWRILIDHTGEWSSVYYPILVPYVVPGQWVNGKEIIGRSGLEFNRSLGYEMFFWKIKYKGVAINPIEVSGGGGY